jgi:4-amino-4-deoxy-L-arabinose transferase-like glycosyltransferase
MKLRHELALVLLLVVVSAPARLLGLDNLPPGLFHDEAYEAIDAVRIATGARPVFLSENYGREPLYAYVMAGLFALGGPSVAAVRATSAIFGLLAIPAAYFWARALFGPAIGLLAAALGASSYWLLQESRLGMRPITLPLFLALASGLVWLAARRGRAWAWPLAGLCLGLSLYTYLPARMFPAVIGGQALLGLWARRVDRLPVSTRGSVVGLACMALVATLAALPLLIHFQNNPDDVFARSSVVSIFASEEGRADPLSAIGRNLVLNAGMFVWRGDESLRHNLPHRPVFDLLIAPFFLIGLCLSLGRLKRPVHAALWLWLLLMVLPAVLSDSAPHFLRSIGLLPALFVVPALGLVWAWAKLRGLLDPLPAGGRALWAVGAVAAIVAASQSMTWRDYFLELPRQPGLSEAFDARLATLAEVAGNPHPGMEVQLPSPGWSHPTIRFLRPRSFAVPQPRQPAYARFGTNVVLLGYDLDPPQPAAAQPVQLILYWRALREMNASYVETARVLDGYGRVWWQSEGVPGFGTLPTDTWMPGEIITDRALLELSAHTPEGEYQLEIALAQPSGGRRLPVFDGAGRQIGTSVRLDGLWLGG